MISIEVNDEMLNYNGKFEEVIKENKTIKISSEKNAYVSFSFLGTKNNRIKLKERRHNS